MEGLPNLEESSGKAVPCQQRGWQALALGGLCRASWHSAGMPSLALASFLCAAELALTWLLSLCSASKLSRRCITAWGLLLHRPGSCVPRGREVGLQRCHSCIRNC